VTQCTRARRERERETPSHALPPPQLFAKSQKFFGKMFLACEMELQWKPPFRRESQPHNAVDAREREGSRSGDTQHRRSQGSRPGDVYDGGSTLVRSSRVREKSHRTLCPALTEHRQREPQGRRGVRHPLPPPATPPRRHRRYPAPDTRGSSEHVPGRDGDLPLFTPSGQGAGRGPLCEISMERKTSLVAFATIVAPPQCVVTETSEIAPPWILVHSCLYRADAIHSCARSMGRPAV
jgi:hypothetical protein